ncbi:exo-alpha-sialidase [Umezawaea sp.]|uniref:WD40/YVTN/BNR-like repeat-containing protein n=1 Tax=Umezawaea sp. TaxID=1955258 RepID=UPI002ED589DD
MGDNKDETVLLAIGTRKGLWLATSEDGRRSWSMSGPHHAMTEVYAVAIDTRGAVPRILAGVTSEHFGPSVSTSDDLGLTWQEPDHAPISFPEGTDTSLARVWQIAPGPEAHPEVVYAGTEPSALFRSTDGGLTYSLVEGLWNHPHRPDWLPGGGGQAVHTVLPHPTDAERVLVAMSTGGVYRTADGGTTWAPANTGVKVSFMPDEYPEFGQCVHKVATNPEAPDRLYLQNHHGVYRSDNGGDTWESIADGLPTDFGFAMAVHPHRPDVVFSFPIEADARRFPPGARCRVYRTDDAGKSWTALSEGLPDEGFYSSVLRDALCVDTATPAGVYFGSRTGEVFASADEGDHWHRVAEHLPDVLTVRAAVIRS